MSRPPLRLGLVLGLLLIAAPAALAQSGGAQDPGVRPVTRTFAITNARVVEAPGRVTEGATVVVRDGLIEAVGAGVPVPFDADVIEGDSLTVYAGFIDGLGYTAVEVPQMDDEEEDRVPNPGEPPRERAGIVPDRLARTLLDPEDGDVEAWRKAGFTVAHVAPKGGMLAGQGAVILLAGDAPEEMVLVPESSLVMELDGAGGVYPATPMGVMAKLRQLYRQTARLVEADQLYGEDPQGLRRPTFDPVAAALAPSLAGEQPVFFVAEDVLDGHRALRIAGELGLPLVLAGVPESSMLTDKLRAADVPALAPLDLPDEVEEAEADTTESDTTALVGQPPPPPGDAREEIEEPDLADHLGGKIFLTERRTRSFADADDENEELNRRRRIALGLFERNPLTLSEAGVPFAFASLDGSASDARKNLRRMVAAGLPADDALAALTTAPAELLGIARNAGTVEPGKLANLVVTDGDYFAEDTKVRFVFVDGRRFEVDGDGPEEDPDAEVTVVGTWDFTLVTPGDAVSGQMTIEGEPGSYSGTFEVDGQGSLPMENVEVEGNRLSFDLSNTPVGPLSVTGLITDDAFEGEVTSGDFPPLDLSATRRPN